MHAYKNLAITPHRITNEGASKSRVSEMRNVKCDKKNVVNFSKPQKIGINSYLNPPTVVFIPAEP